MLLRWLSACVFVSGIAGLFVACGEESQTLCEPGTEVFCKCRGGYDGTKTCNEDGATFGECTTAEGTCPEIPDTTSSSSGDTGSTTSGGGGGGTGTLGLYEACTDGSECQSGTCEGFCTHDCTSWEECTVDADMLYGDCIKLAGGSKQVCAPYCTSAADCAYGPDVACGGAVALDDPMISFGACAPWGDELAGMPPGTLCDDAEGTIWFLSDVVPGLCSLGNAGVHDVCVFGECTQACFEDADCPMMDCESTGSAPACCTSLPNECGVQ
jgi:hypothetical protein